MAPRAFDLDKFAPAPVAFTLDGRDYLIAGDPDVDVVGRMLRIEETIRAASDRSDVEEIAASTREGKQLLLEMILDYDADQAVEGLKLGTTNVLTLFALILHGGSVAAVIAQALTESGEAVGDGDNGVATAESEPQKGEEGGDVTPLASESTSSGRSSISESTDGGRRDTGSV